MKKIALRIGRRPLEEISKPLRVDQQNVYQERLANRQKYDKIVDQQQDDTQCEA
jgi:hypothetical protein